MLLPDNGKVVIIDDKILEVTGLMAALSSERVPFIYYQKEDGTDLPSKPLDNVRLIFLDLLLIDDSGNQTAKKIISPIVARFRKILAKNNGPYVLVYWSNTQAKYKKEFEKEFKRALKDYKPLLILSLDKSHSGDAAFIRNKLNEAYIRNFGALNTFLFWESIVNKSGGDVVNNFARFITAGTTHDQSLKSILFSLAEAMDKNNVNVLTDPEKIKKAFGAVNSVLLDSLISNVENGTWPNISGIARGSSTTKYIAQIHTSLHLRILTSTKDKLALSTGNIYTFRKSARNRSIIQKMVDKNIKKKKDQVMNSAKLITLDVGPACDYSQGKVECVRFLPGILFEYASYEKEMIKNPEFGYGQCPCFYIGGKIFGMFFDFRFLTSELKDEFQKKMSGATYKIGMELVTDIQAKLARHINRPGIVSIE